MKTANDTDLVGCMSMMDVLGTFLALRMNIHLSVFAPAMIQSPEHRREIEIKPKILIRLPDIFRMLRLFESVRTIKLFIVVN